nr:F-box domain containing protein [Pandoravirus aubagnensis]
MTHGHVKHTDSIERGDPNERGEHVGCGDPAARPHKRICVDIGLGAETTAMTTWADLPDEILYLITQHCLVRSLARLGLVERRTYAPSICQRLWKRLYRAADSIRKVCPAGRACAHAKRPQSPIDRVIRRCRPTFHNVSHHVRRWLDDHALAWLVDRAQEKSSNAPTPWQWDLLWHDPLNRCVCHVPCISDDTCHARKDDDDDSDDQDGEDEIDEAGLVDYRWLYATSLAWPVTYTHMTNLGMRSKRVGRMSLTANRWQGLSALDWPVDAVFSLYSAVATYSGETDDQGQPDGPGTLTVARAPSARSTKTTLFRISGTWRQGRPHGIVRAYNYTKKGGMLYFEGRCRYGKPQGRGLAVYRQRSVFDGVWDDGFPSGAGLFCSADRMERYGAHRRSLHTVMWQVVLRPDGTVACETEFIDAYDEDAQERMHEFASDTDDSDSDIHATQHMDEGDTGGDDEDDDGAPSKDADAPEIETMLDRLTREAHTPRPRLCAHPMTRMDHAGIRDRTGRVIYSGPVTYAYMPKPNRGTFHMRDGTMVTHIGRIKSDSGRLVTVTYPRGDRVACLFASQDAGGALPRVLAFTYSRDAPRGLAGRTIKGSWHVSAMPYTHDTNDVEADNDHVPICETGSAGGDGDENEKSDKGDMLSIRACPKDLVITHLARDPPYEHALDNMAALADFVFWPTECGQEREAFFDHMTKCYGQRWALCRAVANDGSS